MKFGRAIAPIVCLCSAMFAGSANAQTNDTSLYIVNAITGRNVSSTDNPAYPIDVLVNGQFCIVKGAAFGDILGPFTETAGNFNFKVTVANTGSPCSGSPIYQVTTALSAGATYIGILSTDGAHQINANLLEADLASIPAGQSRVVVYNLTDQSLSASLTATSSNETNSLNYIAPLTSQTATAPSGRYTGAIYLAGTQTLVLGSLSANLVTRGYYFYVLAGLTANDSVQLVGPKVIKDVF